MVSVTKIVEFEAAHQLLGHKGKCQFVHGHSYKLEVEVVNKLKNASTLLNASNLEEAMVIDFGDLKNAVLTIVNGSLDHKFINDQIKIPTAERMVILIANNLPCFLSRDINIVRVRLWETSTSYAEWRKY